jgi:hypothetical protein
LLSAALAVRQFHRGKWTREQLDEELARQGWSKDRIDALVFDASQRFSDSELKAQRARNVIDDATAATLLKLNGWPDADARAMVAAWKVERVYAYADRELSALASAYVNRDISDGTFSERSGSCLPESTLASSFKSYAEHARTYNVKHLSHAEIKDAVTRGILTRSDYRDGWTAKAIPRTKRPRSSSDAPTDISDARELDKKRAEAEAARVAAQHQAAADKGREGGGNRRPQRADVPVPLRRGAGRGARAPGRRACTNNGSIDLKYAESDRAFLVALVEQGREDYLAAQQRKQDAEGAQPDKAIGLPALERAVVTGRASLDDYRRRLESDGYAAGDVTLMVQLGERRAARSASGRREADGRGGGARRKGLSLAQEEKSVRQGLRSLDAYRGFLAAQGFRAGGRRAPLGVARPGHPGRGRRSTKA